MITFPVLFINLLSILMLGILLVVIFVERERIAARELLIATSWMLLWSLCSFFEMVSSSFPIKVLWRNLTQIGVFYTPVATLIFILSYTGYFSAHRRKIAIFSYLFQSVPIVLILTNEMHNLMRVSVYLVRQTHYQIVGVQTTVLGKFFISGNFLFMLVSLMVIVFAVLHISRNNVKQMISVLIGMSISILYALLKVGSDGYFLQIVPISGVFVLTALLMLRGILRFDLLKIAPIARGQAFQFLGEGMIICAADARVLDANPAAKKVFGESLIEIGENLLNHVPKWYDTALQGHENTFEVQMQDRWFLATMYPIIHTRQQVIGSITLINDVTAIKEREDLLLSRAQIDSMTGFFNRPTFIEQAEKLISKAKSVVQFIYFDIDHFKTINDQYGHRGGDSILESLGRLILSRIPKRSIAGRMGGEEFAIVCIDTKEEDLVLFAESLCEAVSCHEFFYEDKIIKITISIGVCSAQSKNFNELYRQADQLLYEAKRAGRNCVRFRIME